ncbi:MAG: ABC transporter substrate-binding protein [Spirochaetales bacterium]|nr:ABC transporter substrate-binding protein [Spirochaetales bacterium]
MKRVLLLVVTVLMTACFAFGNGQQDASGKGSEDSGRTVISYWGDWGGEGQKQFEFMLNAFNESQDQITAEYVLQQDMVTKFLTASVSGDAPDLMFWDRFRTALYAPKGVLLPIEERMVADGISPDAFYSEAIRELTNDGHLYGLPLTVDCRALFYNKAMFAEKGLEPPQTWDELLVAAKALTEWDGDKMIVAGMSLNDVGLFNMWLQQAGGQMLNDDGQATAFNTKAGKQVLDFWKELMDAKVYTLGFETGLGEGIDAFATGKVAMTYSGPWMLSTYESYGDNLDFGVVPPPAGPQGDHAGLMGGFGLVIPSAAKHKDESWELMKWWLTVPENAGMYAQMSKNIPGVKMATEDAYYAENPYYPSFIETFEFAKIRPTVAQYPNMEIKAVIPQLQMFMEGKLSAQEALDAAQEMGDILLQEKVK